MDDSLVELKSSRSVSGKDFPNFEMLDAKIASALNKIIQNSQFKKKVSPRGAESPKRGLLSARKTYRLHDLRLLSSAHDAVSDYADLFSVTLRDDTVQEFDTRWEEVLLSMTKNTT